MLNPFIELNSRALDLERKRRERLKIGVYSILMVTTLLLMGLLIQGCRAEQRSDATVGQHTELTGATDAVTNAIEGPGVQPKADSQPPAAVPTPATTASIGTVSKVEPASHHAAAPLAPANQPSPASLAGTCVVKNGDTLAGIAKAHGTSVKALKGANGLKTDRLVVGKELKLPMVSLASQAR